MPELLSSVKATEWPSTLSQAGVDGVGDAYIGLDINNGMSPIYSYFAAVSPKVYANWYYDIMLTYDWADTNTTTGADFAGVMTVGKNLDWSSFLGISATLLAAFQYFPQIKHTYTSKLVGALSIGMMVLQTPGAFLMAVSIGVR